MTRSRRLLVAGVAAAVARVLVAGAQRSSVAGRFTRVNHRGRPVTLLAGPALATATAVTAYAGAPRTALARSAFLVGAVSGALGAYDDIASADPGQRHDKGLRGHLAAARQGRISSGLIKMVGLAAVGLAAGGPVARGRLDRLVTAGVIAGTANLVNLFDLRPGRALKIGLLLGLPALPGPAGDVLAGPMGAAAGLLPADLHEDVMIGDCGANALGGIIGVALAVSAGRTGRVALLAALTALTVASERVSFTAVIESTPLLRELDALGRRATPALSTHHGTHRR